MTKQSRTLHRGMTRSLVLIQVVCMGIIGGCSSSLQVESIHDNAAESQKRPYVLLISIDGYRNDYTDLYSPQNLKKFRDEGSSAKGILPVYPSKTFTNHLSIATGLYSENHGIVANSFYDPDRKESYSLSERQKVADGSWYRGVPLWVAAEMQGMLTAAFFWPGSEAAIQGVRPSYFYAYDNTISHEKRISQVVKWLKLPEAKRPHFIALYFSDVDSAGHHFGPRSEEVREAVLKVDRTLGQLFQQVNSLKLPLDILVVSDHGMQELDSKKVEYLDDYLDLNTVRLEGSGPQVLVYVKDPVKIKSTYELIRAHEKHFQVYERRKMPEKFHYSHNSRSGDLVIVAEAPYSVGVRNPQAKMDPGNHGYDPDVTPSMQGIFYAEGPQIKKKQILEPFRNIHVYPLILKILGLKTLNPIDGKIDVLAPIYESSPVK